MADSHLSCQIENLNVYQHQKKNCDDWSPFDWMRHVMSFPFTPVTSVRFVTSVRYHDQLTLIFHSKQT